MEIHAPLDKLPRTATSYTGSTISKPGRDIVQLCYLGHSLQEDLLMLHHFTRIYLFVCVVLCNFLLCIDCRNHNSQGTGLLYHKARLPATLSYMDSSPLSLCHGSHQSVSFSTVSLFQECHRNRIIQYIAF